MKTKAIFLDVDGTLISFKTHKIPQTTIDALNQVHNNGIKIIIATGRVATDLGELDSIPYDAVVSLNAGLISVEINGSTADLYVPTLKICISTPPYILRS